MRAWLRSVLDSYMVGLVPIDADRGRRERAAEKKHLPPDVNPLRTGPRPQAHETEWIPNSVLYGPPL